MRVLFDQGTPVPLRKLLEPHLVDTAFERGWSALKNGDLLSVAEQAGFEGFVKIRLFNAVNIECGYKPLTICSPREVVPDETNE